MTDNKPTKLQGTTPASGDARKYKKKLSALLLSTVAAGGVMSMLGWEAQAHGNASSHRSAAPTGSGSEAQPQAQSRSQIRLEPQIRPDSMSRTQTESAPKNRPSEEEQN